MHSATPWRAVLVPDGVQRAALSACFRSEQHLRVEGETHSLIVEDGGGLAAGAAGRLRLAGRGAEQPLHSRPDWRAALCFGGTCAQRCAWSTRSCR